MVRVAIVAVLAFVLGGCAGTVGSMVRESDKDPAFSFDGSYIVTVDHPGGRQDMGPGWFSKCSARQFTSGLTVTDSKITWPTPEGPAAEGFVDSQGRFRLEQPLGGDAKATSGTLSDGTVTLILQGDISEDTMRGLLVYGIAQFTNRGCSYPVSYSKN